LTSIAIATLHCELCGEYVRQFGSVSVAATSDLVLIIIVIVAGEQVAKHHFRHIHVVFLVHLHGQSETVVFHCDRVLLGVDVDLDGSHSFRVALEVVRSIHQDLVENLEQAGHELNIPAHHLLLLVVPNPELVMVNLD